MIPPLFATAVADATVTGLLGASPCRLYPFDEAPEGVALPYAVWHVISGSPDNNMDTTPDTDGYLTQVDIYAATGASARAVAAALRDAFEPVAHITRWGSQGRDPQTHNYRYSFDVSWIEAR